MERLFLLDDKSTCCNDEPSCVELEFMKGARIISFSVNDENYYVSGTIQGSGESPVNKRNTFSALEEATF